MRATTRQGVATQGAASMLWARVRALVSVLHRVVGAPDYERYLAHERMHHPGRTPLTREAFVRERLDARYSKPGARCC